MSGSLATRFRNLDMQASPSRRAASKFTSITFAPFSTCCLATLSAVSKSSFSISLRNLGDPVTLVRSPTIKKGASCPLSSNASNPLSRRAGSISGICRGGYAAKVSTMAAMCSGVVPQQPPARLSKPSLANPSKAFAVSSGVSS